MTRKKLLAIFSVVALMLAIFATVYLAGQEQDVRQKATGEQTEFYFSQVTTQQNSNLYFTYNQPSIFSLYLDTKGNAVSGFDITITFPNSQGILTVNNPTEGDGASRFTSPVFNNVDASSNTIRFAKVTTDTNTAITGVLHLADITITGRTQAGNGNVVMTNAIVTSATSPTELTSSKPTASYTISAAPTRVISSLFASITGPATGNAGQPLQYNATANGQNIQWVRIYQARTDSDVTKSSSWTLIAENNIGRTDGRICESNTICKTSGAFTPTVNGNYYIAVNASDAALGPCSGNPKWDAVPGWKDCGSNDLITLIVGGASTGNAQFTFTLNLTGIGKDGNKSPKNTQRPIEVELFDSNNEPLPLKAGTVSFNNTANLFKGTVDMGSLAAGNYTIKVKSSKYLKKLIPGITTIVSGRTTPYIIPSVTLVVGDANSDNKLNITDYNMILACFAGKSCSNKDSVDFDDDEKVDGVDYNLFIRSLSVQEGD